MNFDYQEHFGFYMHKVIFDLVAFVIIQEICLAIIFGIICDTFSENREE